MPVAGNIGPGRPCCRQVATTVNIRSANRLPDARSVPPLTTVKFAMIQRSLRLLTANDPSDSR
jgi:hypothetical protein